MLDPTKPDRSFLKWALITRGKTPTFVSDDGKVLHFDTRQEARDYNHLRFNDIYRVVKARFSLSVEK